MSVVLEKAFNTTKLPCSSPILLGSLRFESFALQNIKASFNNEATNVNVCTKHKPNFILREFTSFMNKFEVVSLFFSSGKYLSNLFVFVHFIQTLFALHKLSTLHISATDYE